MSAGTRGVRLAALVLLGLLVLALAALAIVGGTTPGARWAIDRFGPPELSVERVDGRILGDLLLEGVRYEAEAAEVSLRSLRVRWAPGGLLRRTLAVEAARAHGVTVRMRTPPPEEPPEPESPEPPDLEPPLRVEVDSAVLTDIVFHAPPAPPPPPEGMANASVGTAKPVRVERIELRGEADRLGVVSFDARASAPAARPEIGVEARLRGRVEARGEYPLDLRLRWTARRPGEPLLAGDAEATGDLSRLAVTHRLRQPVPAHLEAEVRGVLEERAWTAKLRMPRFRLDAIRPEWPAHQMEASIEAVGESDRGRGSAIARLVTAEGEEVTAALEGAYAEDRIRLDSLVLGMPPAEGRLAVSGEVSLAPDRPRFRLAGEWRELAWPPTSEAELRSSRGDFRLEGSTADYELTARARISGPDVPCGDWRLEGRGDTVGLAVRQLRGRTLDGEVRGQGRLAWAPRPAWRLELAAEALRPEEMWPRWPGEVSFRLATEGVAENGLRRADLHLAALSGQLRGDPLEGEARLRLEGARWTAETLRLRLGDARMAAVGVIGDRWDASWELEVPDLARFAPDTLRPELSGNLAASGSVEGARRVPRVEADLLAEGLRTGDLSAGRLEGAAAVDLSGDLPSRLNLEVSEIEGEDRLAPGLELENVTLRGEGRPSDHRLILTARAREDSLWATLAGRTVEEAPGLREGELAWEGRLEELALESGRSSWRLRSPAPLRAGPDAVRLEGLCWDGDLVAPEEDTASVCLAGQWTREEGGSGELRAEDLSLALLTPFLPPRLEPTGVVVAEAEGRLGPDGEVEGSVSVRAGPGVLRYQATPEEVVERSYDELALDARVEAGVLEAELALDMEDGMAEGRVRAPVEAGEDAVPLEGELTFRLDDRGLTGALAPDLAETDGRLAADLTISGTTVRPAALGEITLEDARAAVLPLGIELEQLELRAEGQADDRWRLAGSARSGEGELRVDGTARLGTPDAAWAVDLDVRGEEFEAYNTVFARVSASPELRVEGEADGFRVRGDLHVPAAEIAPEDLQLAIQPTEDEVLVGPGVEEEPDDDDPGPIPVWADVRVTAGEAVFLDGFGVEGRLVGDVTVHYAPEDPLTGRGELDIREGTYTAYRQELTIERGRLIFPDAPITNPGLDILVTRRPEPEILVGMEVGGTLREPETLLFSEPVMPDAEALSWLLLGRSLTAADPGEGELLADAARSLGFAGGELLAARLAAAFGLQEARVERDHDGASLILGAQLAPNVYVAYTVGLFDTADVLNIRYEFGRWTLRTRAGFEKAADLLFRAEDVELETPEVPEDPATPAELGPPGGGGPDGEVSAPGSR